MKTLALGAMFAGMWLVVGVGVMLTIDPVLTGLVASTLLVILGLTALVEWYGELIDRCGVERRLPPAFADLTAADLEREMLAPETQYMRQVTAREASDADISRFAARMMAMA